MIRINLMPRAEARRQAARQRERQIGFALIAGLIAIIAIAELVTRREAASVEATADQYREELAQLNQRHAMAIQLEKKRDQLEKKLATIRILERQRTGPVHVLDDLSTATPEKLWLTEMHEAGSSLTLIGKGLDNQTIALFMRSLGQSPYFEGVDLVETKQVEEGQAKYKEFTISARVVYAGRPAPSPAPAVVGGAASTSGTGAPPS